ncbi:LOW QUALITY PROTEIN: leucine-rich repeat-containing protein 15-like [Elysia marginata]|uniref:Leucine-rich repeat-containing protein 15-like n=1 Tax=Elysia marginata TaxID=1093978 RepID=A0AAV4JZB6_9GAST|nr:LOW QUALITY PROTEIN: leucine-rich repeat-containing protein 15-like [Elysia marginata]
MSIVVVVVVVVVAAAAATTTAAAAAVRKVVVVVVVVVVVLVEVVVVAAAAVVVAVVVIAAVMFFHISVADFQFYVYKIIILLVTSVPCREKMVSDFGVKLFFFLYVAYFGQCFCTFHQSYKPMQPHSGSQRIPLGAEHHDMDPEKSNLYKRTKPRNPYTPFSSKVNDYTIEVKNLPHPSNRVATKSKMRSLASDAVSSKSRQQDKNKAIFNKWTFPRNSYRKRLQVSQSYSPTGRETAKHRDGKHTSSGEGCPPSCRCDSSSGETVHVVDCSNKGFTNVPALPRSTREVYLQDNSIQEVPCDSFSHLRRLSKLNLSRNRIRMLWNCSFNNLTMLQHLWLSENQIASFPPDVFALLTSLLNLDLSQNTINALNPNMFINLTKLLSLNLGANDLTQIKNHTFHGLSSLAFLSLRDNSLRYLPGTFQINAFHGLESLESLNIGGNQPDFPHAFTYPDLPLAKVTTLRRLWMDGHPRELGQGFSSLLQLSHLSFTGFCSMNADMPAKFFENLATKQPFYLSMTICSLTAISPEVFKAIPNIYSLDLSFNKQLLIDGFEKASKGLENSSLTILNLTDIVLPRYAATKITNTSFRYLKNTKLKILIVEHCKIVDIAAQAYLDLPLTLEYLSFRSNHLISLKGGLALLHLTHLKVLDLSEQLHYSKERKLDSTQLSNISTQNHNKPHTADLPDTLLSYRDDFSRKHEHLSKSMVDTQRVYTSSNVTTILNETIKPGFCDTSSSHSVLAPLPVHLEEFYVSDSKINLDIPPLHVINNAVLRILDWSGNGIKCFGGPIFGVPSLQHLDLSRNFCIKLNPIFFSHMPSLKTLLLHKNMLGPSLSNDVRGVIFSTLINLQILDLSSNVIQDLPKQIFEKNTNVQILNLSNNEIRNFLPSLANNKKLETLDLTSNTLVGFSKSTCDQLLSIKRSNPNFTTLIGKNSGFLCDCNGIFYLQFLLDHREIFKDVETFHCHLANGSIIDYSRLPQLLPQLGVQCLTQPLFVVVLTAFFLLAGCLMVCALYHFKRWQWKYLYYLSKSRLLIGSTFLEFRPVAHAFITYDQISTFLPRATEYLLTYLFTPLVAIGNQDSNKVLLSFTVLSRPAAGMKTPLQFCSSFLAFPVLSSLRFSTLRRRDVTSRSLVSFHSREAATSRCSMTAASVSAVLLQVSDLRAPALPASHSGFHSTATLSKAS